jgi:hypothetical protein
MARTTYVASFVKAGATYIESFLRARTMGSP